MTAPMPSGSFVKTSPSAPHALAEVATGRLRSQRDLLAQALDGRVKPQHRLVLTEL